MTREGDSGREARRESASNRFGADKPLYTISVAAEILATHPRTLMMYEDVDLVTPFRTATNRRRYSQRDIRRLQVIQQLTREWGVNLAGVRLILQLFDLILQAELPPPTDLQSVFNDYAEVSHE